MPSNPGKNQKSPLATPARFLYLNVYAFLLLLPGIGIAFIPLYRLGWWAVAVQAVIVFFLLRGSLRLFTSWKDKKRKYNILMERNATELRPETFTEYMQAPCGRLLTKVVLSDLGRPTEYSNLLKLKQAWFKDLGCKPHKTVIYINKQAL